jgi:hypothetical protein
VEFPHIAASLLDPELLAIDDVLTKFAESKPDRARLIEL